MIALHFAVQRTFQIDITESVIAIDNRVGLGSGSAFGIQNGKIIKRLVRSRQLIDGIALFFAFAAPDTARVVK